MQGLWLSLDVSWRQAIRLVDQFGSSFLGCKVHEVTESAQRDRIKILRTHGARRIFVDTKIYEKPDKAAARAKVQKNCGADFVTVHASGGQEMMRQVVETGIGVYAVLQLTSMSSREFHRYYRRDAWERMIEDAVAARVNGFICPPARVRELRCNISQFGKVDAFEIVSPGIRFANGHMNGHQDVRGPRTAILNGATQLVIGEILTKSIYKKRTMGLISQEVCDAIGL